MKQLNFLPTKTNEQPNGEIFTQKRINFNQIGQFTTNLSNSLPKPIHYHPKNCIINKQKIKILLKEINFLPKKRTFQQGS